ncbi:MAG: ATP-binding protein [Pseudomonadota bacterium]
MNVLAPATWRNLTPYIPLLAYILFACAIALAGYQGFRKTESLIQAEKLSDLGAIADLKVDQIVTWRELHRRRAKTFSGGSLLAAEFRLWLEKGKSSDEQEQKILRLLTGLQPIHGYATASLLDRQGVLRITTGNVATLDEAEVKLAQEAMNGRQPIFSDIDKNSPGSQMVRIFLAAPLVDAHDKDGQVVGAIVLRIDPYDFLYPLIQSWPGENLSAETLLVRQEGDKVVFINELRHQKGTALSLRIPLSTPDLPAAMVIHGARSTMNGIDYRGVPVVAAMRQVPGTTWYMIAKMDKDEIFAPINQLKRWAASLGLAYAVIGGLFFFVWLRGVQARQKQLKAEHDAALEREMRIRHFEFLTKYANDIILLSDEKGRIVDANVRAVEAYGYTREELLRMRITDLCSADNDHAAHGGQVKKILESVELRFEDIHLRKDGRRFPVEVSARVIEVQNARYIQGIIRDLGERKQLEEMRAKMEHAGRLNIAGEMASGMAHELSQPLTACNNYLEVCLRRMEEETWDREKLRSTLRLASIQAERAGKIINHLKDMVRKQGHERVLIDVNLLAREVMSLLEDEIKRLGISLYMTLSPLPQVMACRVEIEQVLYNLYKNAIEAMHSWPQRELRVSSSLTETGEVLIAVSDSGKGILPSEMENLFNPFHSTKKGGLGLGLVICRSIVENHGGQIWGTAKREFGAEFCFTLPVEVLHE